MASFASIQKTPTAAPKKGNWGGGKSFKKFSDMTEAEKKEWIMKKQQHVIDEAKRMSEGGAGAARGHKYVKLWEAEIERLVFTVDEKGRLSGWYNHGTPEKQELHGEAYESCSYVTMTRMLSGAGMDYKQNNKWKHMCQFNLGLPMPAGLCEIEKELPSRVDKSCDYWGKRIRRILHECITNEKVYPGLRAGPDAQGAQVAKISGAKPEDVYNAKAEAWKGIINLKTDIIHEKPGDTESKGIGFLLEMNSHSFFQYYDKDVREVPAEVLPILSDPNHERYREAVAIQSEHDQGNKLMRVRVFSPNGTLIECGVFDSPLREMTPILSTFIVTWYEEGPNCGSSYHPGDMFMMQNYEKSSGSRTIVDTSKFSMRSPRTSREKAILRFIKAKAPEDKSGVTITQIVEEFVFPAAAGAEPQMKTEELTAALNAVAQDKVIMRLATGNLVFTDETLDIEALENVHDEKKDPNDISELVAKATSEAEKRRIAAAEEAAKAAEEAEKKRLAEIEAAKVVIVTVSGDARGAADAGMPVPDAKRAKHE